MRPSMRGSCAVREELEDARPSTAGLHGVGRELGGEGPMSISVDNWAQLKGTHSYEIICSFGTRVERRYLDQ